MPNKRGGSLGLGGGRGRASICSDWRTPCAIKTLDRLPACVHQHRQRRFGPNVDDICWIADSPSSRSGDVQQARRPGVIFAGRSAALWTMHG